MPTAETAAPRILVVGCGGIGGVVAAHLAHVGHDVTPLTKNELIADAINAYGLRTRGEQNVGAVRARAVHALDKSHGAFDYALLCTQPPQVEDAARSVLPFLAEKGAMVVFQNGLCEPRIAEIAGADRVIGGIVAWGATMEEPGVYDRTASGGFTLGRIEGPPDARVRELEKILEAVGPVTLTENLMGARWSKLAISCAITSLGVVGGDRLGALLRKRFVRRLALEIMTETVEVARAEHIKLEKVSGTIDLDWIALTEEERAAKLGSPGLFAKHALLVAVGTRYRRLRSSMLNAIERGRPVAVDFLNGEVVSRGERYGIPTPINAALLDEVKRIAAKKARSAHETLAAFFQRTRELLGRPTEPAESEPPAVPPDAPEAASESVSIPVELASPSLQATLPSPDVAPPPVTVEPADTLPAAQEPPVVTKPSPIAVSATQPSATEPSEPEPTEPAPVEAKPDEPAPVEPAPVEPAPVEPKPDEPYFPDAVSPNTEENGERNKEQGTRDKEPTTGEASG
jgi:2-dehydropantoate 2-reductase